MVFFKYFLGMFTPKIGEDDSHFDDHIFQMGWFNHHLETHSMGQKFVVIFFGGILSEKKKCKIATNKMLNRKFPDVHVLNHLRGSIFVHDLWGMVYLKAPFGAWCFLSVVCLEPWQDEEHLSTMGPHGRATVEDPTSLPFLLSDLSRLCFIPTVGQASLTFSSVDTTQPKRLPSLKLTVRS